MGNELFGLDIAGIINDAFSGALLPATITKETLGARDPANLTAGRAVTTAEFQCTGFWEDFTGTPPPGVTLELNDRKAVLIGDSIPAGGIPARNDLITIEEATGPSSLYVVKQLARDPAAAVYTYLCRDRRGPDGV